MNAMIDFLLEVAEEAWREQRIRKGMELLDARQPGWLDEINLHTLNLMSCTECVVGQVFDIADRTRTAIENDWNKVPVLVSGQLFCEALGHLGVDYNPVKDEYRAWNYGFEVHPTHWWGDFSETYQELQNTWHRVILLERGVTV